MIAVLDSCVGMVAVLEW